MSSALARALVRTPGAMNKTETAYADHLRLREHAKEIRAFLFEAVTFKLAPDCRYTPDFLVVTRDDVIELHEVKGFWRDDAKVKLRVAATRFPFLRFLAVRRERGGGWTSEPFEP